MSTPCPAEVKPLPNTEEWKKVLDSYEGIKGFVRVGEKNFLMHEAYDKFKDYYYNFKLRDDDVFVSSIMKTGSTWLHEIIWGLQQKDFDMNMKGSAFLRTFEFEGDSFICSMHDESARLAYVELQAEIVKRGNEKFAADRGEKFDPKDTKFNPTQLQKMPNPDGKIPLGLQTSFDSKFQRIYKSHVPLSLLNPKLLDTAKVIHIIRNPKDVLTSSYHMYISSAVFKYKGSYDQFFDEFLADQVVFCPYYKHVAEAWSQRDNPNLHIVFYEHLKSDLRGEMRKINKFLGTNQSEEQMAKIADFVSITSMKKRESEDELAKVFMDSKGFVRKAVAGGWKDVLTPDQVSRINAWIKEKFGPLQLPVDYTKI